MSEIAGVRDTLIVAANNPTAHGGLEGLRAVMRVQAERLRGIPDGEQMHHAASELVNNLSPGLPLNAKARAAAKRIRSLLEAAPAESTPELTIAATRHYGGDAWFREYRIGKLVLLANLDDQEAAREWLHRAVDAIAGGASGQ